MFKTYSDIISTIANTLTTLTSGIVIYVFLTKKDAIAAAYRLFLNYSFQTTLTELKEKLERLNEYHAGNAEDIDEIKNILHEIAGQIRGNPRLKASSKDIASRIEAFASGKKISEPHKRSLIAELREVLRNIQVNNYLELSGKDHE